jgi:hypothetical protein
MTTTISPDDIRRAFDALMSNESAAPRPLCLTTYEFERVRKGGWSKERMEAFARASGFDGIVVAGGSR